MSQNPLVLVVLGSILGAVGQVLLKMGATDATKFIEFWNLRVAGGLTLYALGTVFWILALSRWPLSKVYPFTVLTFVIVYVASFWLLGEPMTGPVVAGGTLVLAGLLVIVLA